MKYILLNGCWQQSHKSVILDQFYRHHVKHIFSLWSSLKSPASRLFTQTFIQTQIKENI